MNLPVYLEEVVAMDPVFQNPLQEEFARLLSEGHTTARAARKLEITLQTGRHWAALPEVQNLARKLKAERLEQVELTVQEVIENLQNIMNDENAKNADRISAANTLARMFPEFSEKHHVTGQIDKIERVYIGINVEGV